jgi:hypothetical protein
MEGHLSTFTSLLDRQLTGYVMFSSSVLRPHFVSLLSHSSRCSLLFSELKILSSLTRSTLLVSISSLSYSNLTRRQQSIIVTSIRNMHPQSAAHAYSVCHSWFSRNQSILVLRHLYLPLTFDLSPYCLHISPLHSLQISYICSIHT